MSNSQCLRCDKCGDESVLYGPVGMGEMHDGCGGFYKLRRASMKEPPACKNCGYPRSEHHVGQGWCIHGGPGLEDASQYEPSIPPTPASPETPAELGTLLNALEAAVSLVGSSRRDSLNDEYDANCEAARAALVALYDRQREEIERRQRCSAGLCDYEATNHLCDGHNSQTGAKIVGLELENASLSSQLERLNRDSFTREDVTRLRDWASCWSHQPFNDLANRIEARLPGDTNE